MFSSAIKADSAFVEYGAEWKYFDQGFLPSPQWMQQVFNDSAWLSGNGELGYGDGDETTVVEFGSDPLNKYITTYFRKTINIQSPSSFGSFHLNIKRDDGAVIYVNGVEVFRSNMPSGTIANNTLASTDAVDDGNAEQTILLSASQFVSGNNLIAVEIHQYAPSSSDISFDLELNAFTNFVPQLIRQPYLQMLATDGITIRWRTNIATPSVVCYGLAADSLIQCVSDSVLATDHEIRIQGLSALTKYFYSIGDGINILQGDSMNYFTTSPIPGTTKPTKIWVMADTGVNTVDQNTVRDAFLNYNDNSPIDLLLMLGDNAYNAGTDQEYQDAFFQNHYEDILKYMPLFTTAGNHENYTANALTQTGPYYDIFTMPKNGECGGTPSGTEAYYSFDYGNIHFVCLETNTPSLRTIGSPMLSWLQNDLAATNQKWKIIFFHNPPYTKGGHDSDTETDLIEIRQNIVPILEQYKIDLVLSGHSHTYERSYFLDSHYGFSTSIDSSMLIDTTSGMMPFPFLKRSDKNYKGAVYIQTGCSGVVEAVRPSWPHPAMRTAHDNHLGSLLIEIKSDTLNLKFIDNNVTSPQIQDEFSIVKQCDIVAAVSTVSKLCLNDDPVTLHGTPSGGTFFGNGVSDSTFNPAIAGSGTHVITYLFTNSQGCYTEATTSVEVIGGPPSQPSSISGTIQVCPPSRGHQLYIQPVSNADSYSWSSNGSNGILFTTATTDTIITFDINVIQPTYQLQVLAVNFCGNSAPQQINLSSVKNVPVSLQGSTFACELDSAVYRTFGLNALTSYWWSAPSGALINGQPSPVNTLNLSSVNVVFPPSFLTGNVCVSNKEACLKNNDVKCLVIKSFPDKPTNIQGISAVLPGTGNVTYSVAPVDNANGYDWILPVDATLISGQNTPSIVVDFAPTFAGGILSVVALSDCNTSAPALKMLRTYSTMFSATNYSDRLTLSSDKTEQTFITLFPNPAQQSITLQILHDDNNSNFQLALKDISGKLLISHAGFLKENIHIEVIDIQTLQRGIYFVEVTGSDFRKIIKLVKD